jgi:addiction module HigA family antidote
MRKKAAMPRKLPPLHPGEVLREEFLVPLRLSPGALAKAMGVPRTRVERIAAESTGITADTALRLSRRSARQRNSGSIYRTATTWKRLSARSASSSAAFRG